MNIFEMFNSVIKLFLWVLECNVMYFYWAWNSTLQWIYVSKEFWYLKAPSLKLVSTHSSEQSVRFFFGLLINILWRAALESDLKFAFRFESKKLKLQQDWQKKLFKKCTKFNIKIIRVFFVSNYNFYRLSSAIGVFLPFISYLLVLKSSCLTSRRVYN